MIIYFIKKCIENIITALQKLFLDYTYRYIERYDYCRRCAFLRLLLSTTLAVIAALLILLRLRVVILAALASRRSVLLRLLGVFATTFAAPFFFAAMALRLLVALGLRRLGMWSDRWVFAAAALGLLRLGR